MDISLKWLKNAYRLQNLSLSLICEVLNSGGFEIEEVIEEKDIIKKDYVLDISLTANRPDLFNFNGLKNEIVTLLKFNKQESIDCEELTLSYINLGKFNKQEIYNQQFHWFNWEKILQDKLFLENSGDKKNFLDFKGKSTFLASISKKCTVSSSPLWLKNQLSHFSQKSINNILDILLLVSLETGYSFFCIDSNKLKNYLKTDELIIDINYVKKNTTPWRNNEDVEERILCLFVNKVPISVIGLEVIEDLQVDNSTTEILVYGGIFNSLQIRKTSQSLNVKNTQFTCLEKNIALSGFEQAYIRLIGLLKTQQISLNKPIFSIAEDSKIAKSDNKTGRSIFLRNNEIETILGSKEFFNNIKIDDLLTNLKFKVETKGKNDFLVHIPDFRQQDIEKEIDLIEEIGRIVGFTKFLSMEPNLQILGHFSKLYKLKKIVREYFLSIGMSEVMNFTVGSTITKNQVQIKNPLLNENSYFRTSLLAELINKAIFNKNQTNDNFEGFEIGRIFKQSSTQKIIEKEYVSGILGSQSLSSDWEHKRQSISWFEFKGFIEGFFVRLNIPIQWKKITQVQELFFHPGRSAEILSNGQIIGFCSQIHPSLAKTKNLPSSTYLFEFDLERIKKIWKPNNYSTYQYYSNYPVSLIDIAYIVPNNISYEQIEEAILKINSEILDDITLFDYYTGSSISNDYYSLAFKLKFKTLDRTITKKEVDLFIQQVNESLFNKFAITIRN